MALLAAGAPVNGHYCAAAALANLAASGPAAVRAVLAVGALPAAIALLASGVLLCSSPVEDVCMPATVHRLPGCTAFGLLHQRMGCFALNCMGLPVDSQSLNPALILFISCHPFSDLTGFFGCQMPQTAGTAASPRPSCWAGWRPSRRGGKH